MRFLYLLYAIFFTPFEILIDGLTFPLSRNCTCFLRSSFSANTSFKLWGKKHTQTHHQLVVSRVLRLSPFVIKSRFKTFLPGSRAFPHLSNHCAIRSIPVSLLAKKRSLFERSRGAWDSTWKIPHWWRSSTLQKWRISRLQTKIRLVSPIGCSLVRENSK